MVDTTLVDDRHYATRRHQPALDGLRGLAVAGVLLFHGGHLTGGYLGVDAFFVLSGFLITSLLLAEVSATSRISLRQFWARRARRLLPALGCVLAAVAVYAAFLAKPSELSTIRGDALATIAYVANWRQIFTSNDYWALFRSPSPLQHTWSLSIEEQFYVLWPLVVVGLTRGKTPTNAARRVLVAACAGTGISFALMQLTFHVGNTSRAYYGTDTRMSSILIGAALAAWLALHGPVKASKRGHLESAAVGAAVVLALAWSRLSGTSTLLYRGGLLICAVAAATLIAAGVHPDRGPVSRALSWRPLRELGLISYGVYLWHWPVYVVIDSDRAHFTGWPLLFVRIVVTLVVSVASFRFIERPIRYGARSTRWMVQATPIVVVTLVVAIVASTAGATSNSAAATTNHGGLLVVGDSVADSLFPGIVRRGIPAREDWRKGCRLLPGSLPAAAGFSANCTWRRQWTEAVQRQDPDVVLMVIGAWDLFDLRPPGSDHFITPGSPEWNRYYTRELELAISVLTARGARLVIPTLPCQGTIPDSPDMNRSAFNVARVRAANAVLKEVVARHTQNVVSPDLFGLLCPLGKFQQGAQGVAVVRRDGVHFSDDGAALVAAFLAPSLRGPTGTTPGTSNAHLVLAYGDVLLAESRPTVYAAIPLSSGVRLVATAAPFVALCDLTGWLRRDLKGGLHPSFVVLETQGGDSTACMRNAGGHPIARDSPTYYAKFQRDAVEFFSTAHASGASVVLIAPPPDFLPARAREQARLALILHDAGRPFRDTVFSNGGRNALGGSRWTKTLPCLRDETARTDCRGGRVVVRGPDTNLFCPTRYTSLAAIHGGCPVYSSGAVRYGRAIASAIEAAVRPAQPARLPTPTPTSTNPAAGQAP